jgi:8-oxo-dGTP diphosphatase
VKLATLCYLKANGKTLMLHRIKRANDMHAGKWNGLGGKLLPGETPQACAIREVQEESGLTLINPVWRGVLTFPAFNNNEDWYVFVFVGRHFSGELIDSAEGVLAWIEDEQLPMLNLWEGDHIFLQWLDLELFFSGHFLYQEERLIEHSVTFYTPQQVAKAIPIAPTHRPIYHPQDDSYCWTCGGPVSKRHCKIICHTCGFTRDCSDP